VLKEHCAACLQRNYHASSAVGRNEPDLLMLSFRNTAWPYRSSTKIASVGRVMIREDVQGSTWASVVAVLAVTCAISVLYLPLILG
jgi:hypothetical protein